MTEEVIEMLTRGPAESQVFNPAPGPTHKVSRSLSAEKYSDVK